jgi:hypothetical protein
MKATNLKRIAVTGAVSGALSLAALGLGAGTANADELDAIAPFVPGELSDGLQAYLPLLESVGDVGSIANLGDLGSIGDLGGVQLQDLMALAGGF